MPVTITHGQLRDPAFEGALTKITNFEGFKDQQFAYNLGKLGRRVAAEKKNMRDALDKLMKSLCHTDEKGQLVWKDGRGGVLWPLEGKEDELREATEDFENVKIELDCHQIPLSKLADVKLAPIEMDALEDVIYVDAAVSKAPPAVVPGAFGKGAKDKRPGAVAASTRRQSTEKTR